MVALLYSCTIALVAIPLAPTTALLALVLHIHLQKKPANPWGAKDAGSFFIKFYFCTVVIFLGTSLYFIDDSECSVGYPLCICEYACGPFIEVSKGYTPLVTSITSSGVASAFFSLVLGNNSVLYALLLMFLLAIFFLRNSLTVYIMTTFQREQDVALTFSSLRRKVKQLENRLRLQQNK
eukprot:jgi/Phyca11/6446/fgenesh1_pm.PHYCAscaffold_12_\